MRMTPHLRTAPASRPYYRSDNGGSGIYLEGGNGHDEEEEDGEDNGHNVFRNNILAFNLGWGFYGSQTSTFGDAFQNTKGDYGGGAKAGDGCLSSDPLFETRTANGYVPKKESPCVDAGDPTDAFDQEPKPNGERIDMGAYGNTPYTTGSLLRLLAKTAAPGCFLSSPGPRP